MKEMKKIENQHNNNTEKPCVQPPLDSPWLLFKENHGRTGYIFSPTSTLYKGFSTSFPDDLSIKKVFNCCCGWLILSANLENDLFLWNPVLSKLIKLPPHQVRGKYKYFNGAVLLSPGNRIDDLDPNCMIIIFVQDSFSAKPFSIMYCLLGQQCWNLVSYGDKIAKFFYPNPIIMNDFVYVEGEVKGGGKKLFCINRIDTTGIVLTEYCRLPSCTLQLDMFKEGYLVGSFGELFYLIITRRGYSGLISFVEAFEFNQVSMKWKKVRDVGDRVFFVDGNVRYSVLSPSKRENKEGSSYHCLRWNNWYSYSFADNSLSTFHLQSTLKLPNGFDRTILYLPDRRLIDEPDFLQMNFVQTGQYEVDARKIKEETKNCKFYEDDKAEKEFLLFCMALFSLPDDLMGFIFRSLNPVDYLNFRLVSKICRLLAPKIEWRRIPTNLLYAPAPISPWLVSFNNYSSTYHLVDSEFGGKYLIKAPKSSICTKIDKSPMSLICTKIVHSKNGWLLLLSKSGKKTLTFYNPLTLKIIKLPKLLSPPLNRDLEICFSSSPTSTNCLVVAIAAYSREIEIFTLQVGQTKWNTRRFQSRDLFYMRPSSCLVSHDGDVYVLDEYGNLGVFKLQGAEILSFESVSSPQDPGSFFKHNFLCGYDGKLFECDGKLFAASISKGGESVDVFAFNSNTTSWEKLDSLGNYALYFSKLWCFSTTVRAEWMKNKIFFPRLHDDNIVYYSIETCKYYSLANKDYALEEYYDPREVLVSGWIEPSWS